MRVLLGLAALVIVLATVAQLVKSQLGGLSVTGVLPALPPASGAAPGLRSAPVAEQLERAMAAGAAGRASEPER